MENLVFFDKRDPITTIKWSECPAPLIPMGIADMDIRIATPIADALSSVVVRGDFGYNLAPYYPNVVVNWMKSRHDWTVDPHHVVYVSGLMSGITAIINLVTHIGEPVAVLSPGFGKFHQLITQNSRTVLESQMHYENMHYTIDWQDLDTKLAQCKLMILSNPHNPMGKVWSGQELSRICALCKKHGTYLLSDEIHADLTLPPQRHTPTLRDNLDYSDHIITATSPGKAFNMAGLFVASYIIPNEQLRSRFTGLLQAHTNILSIAAMNAAYEKGIPWLESVLEYITHTGQKLSAFLAEKAPKIKLSPIAASHLAWLDCTELGMTQEQLLKFFRVDAQLHVNDGASCGLGGVGFVRMNIACSPTVFEQALRRLATAYSML